MAEFRITCVTRDPHQRIITHVGINGTPYSVMDVVYWINNRIHTFHTLEDGYMARVFAKRNYWGTWFLTTDPDGIIEDNLGFLPECS